MAFPSGPTPGSKGKSALMTLWIREAEASNPVHDHVDVAEKPNLCGHLAALKEEHQLRAHLRNVRIEPSATGLVSNDISTRLMSKEPKPTRPGVKAGGESSCKLQTLVPTSAKRPPSC